MIWILSCTMRFRWNVWELDIWSSAVITRSNLSLYHIPHCDDSNRTWIRLQNHNPIARHGRAIGCLLWEFLKKNDRVITAPHCIYLRWITHYSQQDPILLLFLINCENENSTCSSSGHQSHYKTETIPFGHVTPLKSAGVLVKSNSTAGTWSQSQ